MPEILTEKEIRKIAREEALKVQKDVLKEISDIKSTLARLERLLLGEMGSNEEDTLKARANFAYLYTKRNTEMKVVERAIPALEWFEDMSQIEQGCSESKLSVLGKMIISWNSIKWLGGLFGVINLATLLGLVLLFINFIKVIKELGL